MLINCETMGFERINFVHCDGDGVPVAELIVNSWIRDDFAGVDGEGICLGVVECFEHHAEDFVGVGEEVVHCPDVGVKETPIEDTEGFICM